MFKKDVEYVLYEIYSNIGIDKPDNHEEILDFIANDVKECADENFNDSDVAIGFRRFLESKS